MDKITYLSLLNEVAKGSVYKRIKVEGVQYYWDGCEYIDGKTGYTLSEKMANYTTKGHTTATVVEPILEILTDKEKEYLGAVIAPVRHLVDHVCLWSTGGDYYPLISLKNDDMITLKKIEDLDTLQYAGLEPEREYTLEELDL